MNTYIVDFQGFGVFNNGFILKEIAVFHNDHHHHFIVNSPFNLNLLSTPLRRQASWLYQNYHGLTWNSGFTNFSRVKIFLREQIQSGVVYVKGTEKSQWLRELLNSENIEVINLEDIYSCPSLKELRRIFPNQIKCLSHGKCCALQNVYLLSKFIRQANLL